MTLEKYLSKFKNSPQITLVGPFYGDVHDHVHGHVQYLEEPVIFVDDGARWRKSGEGIVVGDGDSFDGEMDVKLNPHKDFSDLAFALSPIPEHFGEVNLIGFLGGRRDHELFNIGESHHFLRARKSPTMIKFDHAMVGYSSGQWRFERIGGFSILAVEETRVGIIGDCRYPCPQTTQFMPLSSLGLSNVGAGTICIDCDRPVFILFEEV
ncbi:hypothetical protein [Candidatus Spongiihabitans sp.]|uniref:hypothetical protein n=1 Tax=Candidatus Spongiihabitans sp. TaxID=3101308 RepID=UPI003C7A9077